MKLGLFLLAMGTYLAAFASLRLVAQQPTDLLEVALELLFVLAILGLGVSVALVVYVMVTRYSRLLFMAWLYAAGLGAAGSFFFFVLPYLLAPLWQHQTTQGIADQTGLSTWILGYPLLAFGTSILLAGILRGADCLRRALGRRDPMRLA